MRRQSRIGLVSIAAPWFDTATAQRQLRTTREWLSTAWTVAGPVEPVTGAAELEQAITELAEARIAALVLQIGTFPDGNAPVRLAEELQVPIIIHGLPEPSLSDSVPLNSLCGVNLSTFTLSALRHPHAFAFGDPSDAEVRDRLEGQLRAAVSLRGMRGRRLALIGFRAPGFYPCVFDELLLRRTLGIAVEHVGLHELAARIERAQPKKAPHEEFPTIEGGSLSPESVSSMERYYGALAGLLDDLGHDLVAIKDWPEIEHFDPSVPGGFWPALGWIQDDGVNLAPEGDVNGAVSMQLAGDISGEHAFFADISAWNDAESTLHLWHYGGAPSLASDQSRLRFGQEGREVEFTLRPGRATLVRLGLLDGSLRLLSVAVEILDRPLTLRRAAGLARTLDSAAGEVVRRMLEDGWEHHVSLAYGDQREAVRAFGRFAGIPVTEL
jgi:L-fucose isomerase-like protein